MRGIIGYISKRKACPILIKGLKQLKYHGYDSAGIALVSDNRQLNVYETKGKVSELGNFATQKDISGTVGITYTRWATHGEPCSVNVHPHYSSSEKLVLIRNDIIKNYAVLKEKFQAKDYIFKSSTDTEVLVQLTEYMKVTNRIDLLTVVQLALDEVISACAITILDKEYPGEIIAVHRSSLLAVDIGEDEFFLASDVAPIVEYTGKVIYLEDGEVAMINRGKELKVIDLSDMEITPEVKKVELKLDQLEKGGYPHFILKEISEQSDCIHDCMHGRINVETDNVVLPAVIDCKEELLNAKHFIIVACGTSWHAGLIGKHLIESFCRIPVEVEYASEFRYRDPMIDGHDVVIAISQSRETADTLAAMELAKSRGTFMYDICNAVSSSIPRATYTGSYIYVGPEIGIASAKAFTGQVTVLTMLALTLARGRGTIDEAQYLNIVQKLNSVPGKMREVLELNDKPAELSKTFTYAHNFIYLGRGYSYPIALEDTLKLKEISYIHAEGYPAAEMKHGPIVLIDAKMPVVAIATQNGLYEKVFSSVQEIRARKGKMIAFVTKSDTVISKIVDCSIEPPETIECLDPLITMVPLQLLAYHIAICKGIDVDQLRNLAEPVIVEQFKM